MSVPRNKAPKWFIPTFMVWIVICNIMAIILAILVPATLTLDATISMIIVILINIVSIIFLYPLLKQDPLTPFIRGAFIWFAVVTIIYIILGAWVILIPGTIQLLADLWYNWKFNKLK